MVLKNRHQFNQKVPLLTIYTVRTKNNMLKVWVFSLKQYGLLGITEYGLWVEIPCIPSREYQNPMGFHRVWVITGYGLRQRRL